MWVFMYFHDFERVHFKRKMQIESFVLDIQQLKKFRPNLYPTSHACRQLSPSPIYGC